MNSLKTLLIIFGLVHIVFWGLGPLFASESIASFFGLDWNADFVEWARLDGMKNILWGLLLISISGNALANKIVIKFTIALYFFAVVLMLLMMFWLNEIPATGWVWWLTMVLCALFGVLLIIFFPKQETDSAAAV